MNNLKKSLEHGRMTSLSDTLTVGLVLVLLFGSIALYLYTRIQQAEQKISLLESILLDLKMSAEIKSYTELPAATSVPRATSSTEHNGGEYAPFDEDDSNDADNNASNTNNQKESAVESVLQSEENDEADNEVDQYKSVVADAVKEENESLPNASKVSVNYEAMTLKELQNLAKSRGITGAGSMKKGATIEALKTSDRSSTVEPGSSTLGGTGSASFLETSSPFQGSSESQ
jgi:hypothetical protein